MKLLTEELATLAGIPIIKNNSSLCLIQSTESEQLLRVCSEREIAVLGIEGFERSGKCLIPDTDLIADFSLLETLPWDEQCLESLNGARAFLREIENKFGILLDFELQMSAELSKITGLKKRCNCGQLKMASTADPRPSKVITAFPF